MFLESTSSGPRLLLTLSTRVGIERGVDAVNFFVHIVNQRSGPGEAEAEIGEESKSSYETAHRQVDLREACVEEAIRIIRDSASRA